MSDPNAPSSPNPAPGAGAPPPQQPVPAEAAAPGSGLAPNIAAGLACLFPLIGGIVFLVIEKKDQFVRFYAMQSLIVGGALLCFSIALNILVRILVHIPVLGPLLILLLGLLSIVVWLGFLVLSIVMIIKAFTNKEWEIPYVGKIAREQLARMAASSTTPPAPTAPTAS